MTMPPFDQTTLRAAGLPPVSQLRDKWPWFVAFGVLAVIAGLAAIALTAFATIASVLAIGIIVMMVGIAEIVTGFRARSWGQTIYWELSGILYVVAGFFAWAEPAQASLIITLLLGAGLLATGIVRGYIGYRYHDNAVRTPLMLSGLVTALLGLIILSGWPSNSLFVIGLLLGIELTFSGVNWIAFGLRLRKLAGRG